jgi:hypothetical protein
MHESSFAGVGGINIFTRSRPAGSEYFYDHAGSTDKTLNFTKVIFTIC